MANLIILLGLLKFDEQMKKNRLKYLSAISCKSSDRVVYFYRIIKYKFVNNNYEIDNDFNSKIYLSIFVYLI